MSEAQELFTIRWRLARGEWTSQDRFVGITWETAQVMLSEVPADAVEKKIIPIGEDPYTVGSPPLQDGQRHYRVTLRHMPWPQAAKKKAHKLAAADPGDVWRQTVAILEREAGYSIDAQGYRKQLDGEKQRGQLQWLAAHRDKPPKNCEILPESEWEERRRTNEERVQKAQADRMDGEQKHRMTLEQLLVTQAETNARIAALLEAQMEGKRGGK